MHFPGFFRGAKIQNFPFGGNHGATSRRHCVNYKPPVLGTLGVGTYGWHKFTQIKKWLKIFRVSMVKNGCGQHGDATLKLTVSQKWTDGIKWFFACWYRFTKIKSWSKFFMWAWSKMGVASLVTGG